MTVAVPAAAAPGRNVGVAAARSAQVADDGASLEDRVRAAAVVGVVAPDSWLVLSERDFVFKLWQNAESLPEVRGSAELALIHSTSTSFVECTVFIESGIHDAKARDLTNEVRDATAARVAREAKQRALVTVEIPVTPELLLLPDREFVYAVYQRSTGPLVRAGALTAFGGTAQQQHDFIATGIVQAREQDRLNEIAADQQKTEAERQALVEREARKRAAAVLGVVADEGLLVRTDDNFVRWVWNTAKDGTEVYRAAMTAVRSTDPAVWKAFIHTGIYAADRRDLEAALKKKYDEYRRLVAVIEADAVRAGRNALARAARAALAGTDPEVEEFLRVGQYQVSDNECGNPVLSTDQSGWGRLSDNLTVTRRAATGHQAALWELAVANGTATTAGIYLPQQTVQPGAIWDVGADVRANGSARARMEIDWYAPTNVFLGHTNGGYLPISAQRPYTAVSGRFTAPAGASRANVLVRVTGLIAGGGFGSTMCAYKPNPTPDVTLTATAGNGTATAQWRTTRTDIVRWTVGRDGEDTRGSGPWSTPLPATATSQQFNLLTNGTAYLLYVIGETAAGPLTPVALSVKPGAAP
jgi:hypothetical protein